MQQAQIDSMREQAQKALDLEGTLPLDQLAETIAKPGISVVISDPEESSEQPIVSGTSIQNESDVTTLEVWLPKSGVTLSISASNQQSGLVLVQILGVGLPSLALIGGILFFVLNRATTKALAPLDDLTALASQISSGQRGGRLSNANSHTELGRTAQAMNEMLEGLEGSIRRAEQAEDSMRQLNQDVSHEMRTPIASIIALADNEIRANRITENVQKVLVSIIKEAKRASLIVNDLNTTNSLEGANPKLSLRKTKFDLGELLNQNLSGFDEKIIKRNYPALEILADRERLSQLVTNLLQNATRHAKSKIDLVLTDSPETLTLAVEDDGDGIPEQDRLRVFDRFVRLDQARARDQGGSGLGLAICKAIAQAHGGTIRATESASLGGAAFVLELPKSLNSAE